MLPIKNENGIYMFNEKRVNDPKDLEVRKKKPVPSMDGFYYFPKDERLAVNKHGIIRNVKTKKVLKPIRNNINGRTFVLITSPGKKPIQYTTHRVIAGTLIGRPSRHINVSFDDLEVNHIDGNRYNNNPSNLEWVTRAENMFHAYKTNLREENKLVEIYDIANKTISVLYSCRECARRYNMSLPTLNRHLNSKNAGKCDYDGYAFRYFTKENTPWPEITETKGNTGISITVVEKDKNVLTIFATIREACKHFKLSYSKLWRLLSEHPIVEWDNLLIRKSN